MSFFVLHIILQIDSRNWECYTVTINSKGEYDNGRDLRYVPYCLPACQDRPVLDRLVLSYPNFRIRDFWILTVQVGFFDLHRYYF